MHIWQLASPAQPRPGSGPRYMRTPGPSLHIRACDHVVVCGESERTPQGERSGKEGSGVPRGQRKEAGRERSRVRRSAESLGARERLERDRERRAAEPRAAEPRGLRCSPFSLPRISHGYFGTLAAHNTCTHARSLVPGPHTEAPWPSSTSHQGVVTPIRAMHSAATGVTICDRRNSPVTL